MSDESNKDTRNRFRSLLSGGEEEKKPVEAVGTPLSRLPKVNSKPIGSNLPHVDSSTASTAAHPAVSRSASRFGGFKFGPAFWTVTGLLSLIVNGILIAVLIVVLQILGRLQSTSGDAASTLLGGLYTNFEKMDRASIVTTIPVDTQVPLNLTVPVQKTTEIVLAQNVVISGARVRINTSAIDIDAPADVTLPAGTKLNVGLNFDLQVQDTIPVHVDVPVNIPLAQTDLHTPFAGLQDVIRPLYCIVEPKALNLSGAPVCK